MSEPKPFASLSSGLLARKGGAKPAMRPQGYGQFGSSLEDLGWDDMGADPSGQGNDNGPLEHVPSSIAALTPAPGGRTHPVLVELPAAPEEPPVAEESPVVEQPPVVEQQRALEEHFTPPQPEPAAAISQAAPPAEPVVEILQSVPLPAPVPELPQAIARSGQSKAAFTLRLDVERHLKLRLASALTRRSAQQIVTEALDTFLSLLPQVDALARQVPDHRAG